MKQFNRVRARHDGGREVEWLQIGKLAIVQGETGTRLHYSFRTQPGTAKEYATYAEHLREQGFGVVAATAMSGELSDDFNELKFNISIAHDSRDAYTIYEFDGFIAVADADTLGVFHAESAAGFLKRQFHGAYEFEDIREVNIPRDEFTELAIRYEDLEYRYNCVLRELGETEVSDDHLARFTAVKHAHFAAIDGDFAEMVSDMFCDMHTYPDSPDGSNVFGMMPREAEELQRDYLCLAVKQTADQTAGARERLDYALGRLTCGDEPLREMDFFAKRLVAMEPNEVNTLCGLIKIYEPEDVKLLVNLTYHFDNVVLAGGIAGATALGKFLVENDMAEPDDEANPNYSAIGAEHLGEYMCAIVDGVLYRAIEKPAMGVLTL